MFRTRCSRWASLLFAGNLIGSHREAGTNVPPASDLASLDQADAFGGSKIGEEREVAGIKLCWCPPGRFIMGSPPDEPERRPGEDQVEVTLTKGFWIGKYEVTQGQWKRVVGEFPGKLTRRRGRRLPGPRDQLRRGRGVLPEADRAAARDRRPAGGTGSSGFPPKRSGSTPAGPGPRPPLRSATS